MIDDIKAVVYSNKAVCKVFLESVLRMPNVEVVKHTERELLYNYHCPNLDGTLYVTIKLVLLELNEYNCDDLLLGRTFDSVLFLNGYYPSEIINKVNSRVIPNGN